MKLDEAFARRLAAEIESELMKDMSLEITGVRPAVIDAELARSLGEYRRQWL